MNEERIREIVREELQYMKEEAADRTTAEYAEITLNDPIRLVELKEQLLSD